MNFPKMEKTVYSNRSSTTHRRLEHVNRSVFLFFSRLDVKFQRCRSNASPIRHCLVESSWPIWTMKSKKISTINKFERKRCRRRNAAKSRRVNKHITSSFRGTPLGSITTPSTPSKSARWSNFSTEKTVGKRRKCSLSLSNRGRWSPSDDERRVFHFAFFSRRRVIETNRWFEKQSETRRQRRRKYAGFTNGSIQ